MISIAFETIRRLENRIAYDLGRNVKWHMSVRSLAGCSVFAFCCVGMYAAAIRLWSVFDSSAHQLDPLVPELLWASAIALTLTLFGTAGLVLFSSDDAVRLKRY